MHPSDFAQSGTAPTHDEVWREQHRLLGRVLLVEDSSVIRHLVLEVLKQGGFDAHAVGDGYTALRLLTALDSIDVVVTDLMLPHMDGLALIREFRLRRPMARSVLMTGHADAMDLARRAAEPPDLVLTKPLGPQALLNAVRWLMGMDQD